jgi:hypothetical protein
MNYETTGCGICWEKHPEWYEDLLRRMKVIFPGVDPKRGWLSNSPESILWSSIVAEHDVPCVVIHCLDGSQHNCCKPCLLEISEGIS